VGRPVSATEAELAILRHVAHSAAEDTDGRGGWCRWGEPEGSPWRFGDYRPLVARGLLARQETWKDVLLRPTAAGWRELARAPG
jgi:hypothetical protein